MEYEGDRWAFWLDWNWGTLGLGVEGELDRQLGDVTLRARLLWLRLFVSYRYDPDTPPLRAYRERLGELLSQAFVTVPVDEYDALKADAGMWRWSGFQTSGGAPIAQAEPIQFHEDPWPGREHAP